jgi:hypothetical protein
MELARGQVTDRPWAMILGALGVRRCTGQLTLRAEGKRYCIAFDHGAVVGASSPLASDSAVRVALIHQMIAPAYAAEITRQIAAAPGREEIEVLAEAARLSLDQTLRLRRKVTEQRAARTFSIDAGEFVVDSRIDIPVLTALAIDIRSVIYLGARMNLSEQRLSDELRQLGTHFQLKPEAIAELDQFGFTDSEQRILDALRGGTSLAELEARYRDLDPRTAQAVIYALASCSICTGTSPPPRAGANGAATDGFSVTAKRGPAAGTPSDTYSRTRTGRDVFMTRVPTGGPRSAGSRAIPIPSTTLTSDARAEWPFDGSPRAPTSRAPAAAPDETGVPRSGGSAARAPTSPSVSRTRSSGGAPATGRTKTPGGAPAPATGRVPTRPTTGRAPTAPVTARTRTPRGLPASERPPGPAHQPRTKSTGRSRTSSSMPAMSAAADSSVDTAAQGDVGAAAREAFKRGQSRLRVENLEEAVAELTRAVELAPHEVDYAATLAWARFCHAKDKQALAQATREALGKAIRKSQAPETARFYLGRVERMLGRDKEALRHFQQVLEAQPRHADAAAEIRVIEKRMAQAAAKESGVFGRKR